MASHGGDRDQRELSRWSSVRRAALLLGFAFGGWLILTLIGGTADAAESVVPGSSPATVSSSPAAIKAFVGQVSENVAAPVAPVVAPVSARTLTTAAPLVPTAPRLTGVAAPVIPGVRPPTPPVLPVLQVAAPSAGSGADALAAGLVTSVFEQVSGKVQAAFGGVVDPALGAFPVSVVPALPELIGTGSVFTTLPAFSAAGPPLTVGPAAASPMPGQAARAAAMAAGQLSRIAPSSATPGRTVESQGPATWSAPPTSPAAPLRMLPTVPLPATPAAPVGAAGFTAPVAAQPAMTGSLNVPPASRGPVSTTPVATLQDGSQPEPSASPD